jgi:aminopeptidase
VVQVRANVQPGQEVLLQCDVAHAPIARAIAEQAYVVGASKVRVEYVDPYVRRSALRHAPEEALTTCAQWELDRVDEFTATEEVFTSPDKTRADRVIRTTRP